MAAGWRIGVTVPRAGECDQPSGSRAKAARAPGVARSGSPDHRATRWARSARFPGLPGRQAAAGRDGASKSPRKDFVGLAAGRRACPATARQVGFGWPLATPGRSGRLSITPRPWPYRVSARAGRPVRACGGVLGACRSGDPAPLRCAVCRVRHSRRHLLDHPPTQAEHLWEFGHSPHCGAAPGPFGLTKPNYAA